MAISINGVNHFAISVPNLEESVAWYQRVLGFQDGYRDELPDIGIKIAHLPGPGIMLEIFQVPGAAPLPADRREPNSDLLTHGNKHLSFGVRDGRAAKEELERMGVEIAFVAVVNDTYGLFIRDNSGNLIELFEEGAR